MNRIITLFAAMALPCMIGVQAFAQGEYEFQGVVVEKKTEAPVADAEVLERGTTNKASTNAYGEFTLSLTEENAIVEISHNGYKSELVVASSTNEEPMTVELEKVEEGKKEMNFLALAGEGGFLMYVLLLLSLIAVYIFGSKWWMIHKAGKVDRNFIRNIRDLIHDGKINAAKELCQKYDNPTARLLEKGIERIGRPLEDIQTAVENMGNVEVARLEKGLPMLATIAGGAPMIGFLGTVIGMIMAFFDMSNAGNNIDITLLSGGIYTAMLTTVGGLFVGIIAYFGYNYLTSQISNLVFKMESTTIEFIDLLHEPAGE